MSEGHNILSYDASPEPNSLRPLIVFSVLLIGLNTVAATLCEFEAEKYGRHVSGSWERHNPLLVIRVELTSGNAALAMFALAFANLLLVLAQLLANPDHYSQRQVIVAMIAALLPLTAAFLIFSLYQGICFE